MARLARICTPFQLVDAVDMHVESHTRTHTRSRMHFTSSLHAHTHTCSRMRSHTCSQTRDMPGLPSSSSAEPLSLSLLVTGTGVDGARGCEGVSDCRIAVTFQATLCGHLLQTLPTPASLPAPPRRFLALTLSRFQCRSHWQSRVCPQWEGKVRLCAYEARCSRLLQTRRHQGAMC